MFLRAVSSPNCVCASVLTVYVLDLFRSPFAGIGVVWL